MYEIVCIVEQGKSSHNDDRAVVNETIIRNTCFVTRTESRVLAAVCDGVGGEAFGDKAAEIIVNYLSTLGEINLTRQDIHCIIEVANQKVVAAQRENRAYERMSSTIAGVYINDETFLIFNVGDSRIYRFRPPYIAQLSQDHSMVAEMKAIGLLPRLGQDHVITKYLGGDKWEPFIEDYSGKFYDDDLYFICSDGIHGAIDDMTLEELLSQKLSLEELGNSLVKKAIDLGSTDNISVILIRRNS